MHKTRKRSATSQTYENITQLIVEILKSCKSEQEENGNNLRLFFLCQTSKNSNKKDFPDTNTVLLKQ